MPEDNTTSKIERLLIAIESGDSKQFDSLMASNPSLIDDVRSILKSFKPQPYSTLDFDETDPRSSAPDGPNTADYINHDQRTALDQTSGDMDLTTLGDSGMSRASGVNPSTQFGDYELLEEIAQGGMGVVYKARQKSLNRIAALKMIKSGELSNQEQVDRFHKEAEAAANLDHPGIVPVYEVGNVKGQHYFTMGFVDGKSLFEVLRTGPLPPKEAARFAKAIAEAVGYAHAKGVIHRDLKPGNVLMTEDGTLRITDFGLAKHIEDNSELTSIGQILGTPSYMPPEQAEGKLSEIGPTADIYAIGATMYCMLVGKPPFQAASVIETLNAVVHSDPVALRSLDRTIPQDLETLCLKCLEKNPRNRYSSAADVVDELARFLDGEPIVARPIGRLERLVKWTKRKPAQAIAAAAVMLLAIIGPWFGISQSLAQKRERDAKDLAEERFDLALDAIEQYYTGASLEVLFKQKGLTVLRENMLRSAFEFYRELESKLENSSDPSSRNALARAYYAMGYIAEMVDDQNEAIKIYQQAIEIQKELVSGHPTAINFQWDLTKSYNNLGNLQLAIGETDSARSSYEQAREMLVKLVTSHETSSEYQDHLARIYSNLSVLKQEIGDWSGALRSLQEALRIREQMVAEQSEVAYYQDNLASLHHSFGTHYERTGNLDAALAAFHKALSTLERLNDTRGLIQKADTQAAIGIVLGRMGEVESAHDFNQLALKNRLKLVNDNPAVTEHQKDLASSYYNICKLQISRRDLAAAAESNEQSLRIREKLVADEPNVPAFLQELASSHDQRADLLVAQGDLIAALQSRLNCYEIRTRLVQEHPRVYQYRRKLADSCHNIGLLLVNSRESEQALKSLDQAEELFDKLVAENSEIASCRIGLASTLGIRGFLLRRMGDTQAAMESCRRSAELYEKLVEENPSVLSYRHGFANTLLKISELHGDTGDSLAALESWDLAIHHYERVVEQAPDNSDFRSSLASAFVSRGILLRSTGNTPAAVTLFGKALGLYRELFTDSPTVFKYQDRLHTTLDQLGRTHRIAGDVTEAISSYKQAAEILEDLVRAYPSLTNLKVTLGGKYCNVGHLVRITDPMTSLEWYTKAASILRAVLAVDQKNSLAQQFLENTLSGQTSAKLQIRSQEKAVPD